MAMHVNSAKKVEYAKLIAETLHNAKTKINASVDEVRSITDRIRMKATDLAYNNIQELAAMQVEAIDKVAAAVNEDIITPLIKNAGIYGEKIGTDARAVQPDLEDVLAVKFTAEPVSETVIAGRGGDEDFNDANVAALGEAAAKFIQIRFSTIVEMGELTNKCKEEDMAEAYRSIGMKFENICNESTDKYNKLKAELLELGVMVAKDIEVAEGAGAAVGSVDTAVAGKSILGDLDY